MHDLFIIEFIDCEMVDNHPNQLQHAIDTSCEYNVKEDMIQFFFYAQSEDQGSFYYGLKE